MIKGNYYDGADSRLHPAALTVRQSDVRIVDAEDPEKILVSAPRSDITISPRLGNLPRIINFAGGGKFETTDNQAIDNLQHQLGESRHNWLHRLESRYILVIAMLIAMVITTWGTVKYGVPATANWIAHQLPASLYQQAGQHTVNYLDRIIFKPSTLPAERQGELREVFLKQLDDSERRQSISVLFRDGGVIGANAFALPSGIVVFTDQMVKLSCDDRELIAIFGHEVGHVQQRHLMRSAIQGSIVGLAVAMMVGDASALGEIIVALPALLLEMSYSRNFEREADDYALQFLQQRNIDSGFFSSIMARLTAQTAIDPTTDNGDQQAEDSHRYEDYLSTHPATAERLEKFGPPAAVTCPRQTE